MNLKCIIILWLLPVFLIGQKSQNIIPNNKLQCQIFSGVGFNKVYNWGSPSELKIDFLNVGGGITLNIGNKHSLLLNYNYIQKGAYAKIYDQNYIFKYSILSPSYQFNIYKDLLKFGAGLYVGYLHEYNLNGNKHPNGKDFDFGMNTGLQSEFKFSRNLSIFISPILEIGLIKFSNSNQFSLQFRYGLKYSFEQEK